MQQFKIYDKQDVLRLTKIRRFETKIGEEINVLNDNEDLETAIKHSNAEYVLFGIPEDIGVKANFGIGGTQTAWFSFLNTFLNTQNNDFLRGEEILLLGHFDFSGMIALIDKNAQNEDERIEALRHAVNTIDDEVEEVVRKITDAGKIPIAIGGGHNNAYPLLKGAAKGLFKYGSIPLAQLNCINLDAHADYRPMEGRHSGNGFRYAEEDGYLQKYCIVGAHENYLQQNVWIDIVNNPFIDMITYEDIFIHEKRNFIQAVAHATGFTEDTYTGVEIDLDCIENALSSAASPCGISTTHVRQFVNFVATDSKVAYLHICEGAIQLTDGRKDESTGKLISYLVCDFLKAHINR
jgi:formiminoglutamase